MLKCYSGQIWENFDGGTVKLSFTSFPSNSKDKFLLWVAVEATYNITGSFWVIGSRAQGSMYPVQLNYKLGDFRMFWKIPLIREVFSACCLR